VTSGTFSSTLKTVSQELGATETVDASATAVTNGPEETTVAPNNGGGGSNGLSGGAIAGIVIGALAGVILLAALVYYVLHTDNAVTRGASPARNPSTASSQASVGSGSTKASVGGSPAVAAAAAADASSPGAERVFSTENPLAKRAGNEML
jgi:hypothetical protein